MKGLAFVCGVGLGILWLIGLGNSAAPSWFTWLDGVAAVLCLIVAASMRSRYPKFSDVVSAALLSVGTFILWIVGMSNQALAWQNWWTFVFACGMGIVAIMAGFQRSRDYPESRSQISEQRGFSEDRDKLRKVG